MEDVNTEGDAASLSPPLIPQDRCIRRDIGKPLLMLSFHSELVCLEPSS